MLASLAVAGVPLSRAIASLSSYPELRLNLYNIHTTETLDTTFWVNGEYDVSALQEIDYLLRDHRTGDVKQIDTRLLSIIYLITQRLGSDGPVSVISGYRSAETNRKLAQINAGVASNSYHIKGQAIDIRIPGRNTAKVRDVGLKLRVGGVGYYPQSNFVHLDTGPPRHW